MTECMDASETLRILNRVLEVCDVTLNDGDSLVVVGVEQVPHQWSGSGLRANANGLDDHQPRPSNAWAV